MLLFSFILHVLAFNDRDMDRNPEIFGVSSALPAGDVLCFFFSYCFQIFTFYDIVCNLFSLWLISTKEINKKLKIYCEFSSPKVKSQYD